MAIALSLELVDSIASLQQQQEISIALFNDTKPPHSLSAIGRISLSGVLVSGCKRKNALFVTPFGAARDNRGRALRFLIDSDAGLLTALDTVRYKAPDGLEVTMIIAGTSTGALLVSDLNKLLQHEDKAAFPQIILKGNELWANAGPLLDLSFLQGGSAITSFFNEVEPLTGRTLSLWIIHSNGLIIELSQSIIQLLAMELMIANPRQRPSLSSMMCPPTALGIAHALPSRAENEEEVCATLSEANYLQISIGRNGTANEIKSFIIFPAPFFSMDILSINPKSKNIAFLADRKLTFCSQQDVIKQSRLAGVKKAASRLATRLLSRVFGGPDTTLQSDTKENVSIEKLDEKLLTFPESLPPVDALCADASYRYLACYSRDTSRFHIIDTYHQALIVHTIKGTRLADDHSWVALPGMDQPVFVVILPYRGVIECYGIFAKDRLAAISLPPGYQCPRLVRCDSFSCCHLKGALLVSAVKENTLHLLRLDVVQACPVLANAPDQLSPGARLLATLSTHYNTTDSRHIAKHLLVLNGATRDTLMSSQGGAFAPAPSGQSTASSREESISSLNTVQSLHYQLGLAKLFELYSQLREKDEAFEEAISETSLFMSISKLIEHVSIHVTSVEIIEKITRLLRDLMVSSTDRLAEPQDIPFKLFADCFWCGELEIVYLGPEQKIKGDSGATVDPSEMFYSLLFRSLSSLQDLDRRLSLLRSYGFRKGSLAREFAKYFLLFADIRRVSNEIAFSLIKYLTWNELALIIENSIRRNDKGRISRAIILLILCLSEDNSPMILDSLVSCTNLVDP